MVNSHKQPIERVQGLATLQVGPSCDTVVYGVLEREGEREMERVYYCSLIMLLLCFRNTYCMNDLQFSERVRV